MKRLILGLNTDHGDSAAALIDESGTIAAMAEERLTRQKHTSSFPIHAIREVLRIAQREITEITDVAIARDPFSNIGPKLAFIANNPKSGLSIATKRFFIHRNARSTLGKIADGFDLPAKEFTPILHQIEHHLAHVASAFYWSPFEKCCAFSIDGAGDFATTMWARCQGKDIEVLRRSYWPHSLGVFYTAICQFLGFDLYGEEFKVMGLSAYGENRHAVLMDQLVDFSPKSGLRLNLDYFVHHKNGVTFETSEHGVIRIPKLWGQKLETVLGPARKRTEVLTQREKDIAASMQIRYERVFLKMVGELVKQTGERNIVAAGGCALNSVANGRMLSEGLVDEAYFHPAASDDGTAVGAAAYVLHRTYGFSRTKSVQNAYLGTEWTDSRIESALKNADRPFSKLNRADLISRSASSIAAGQIVGWFQGREEWGPRALGNRSILCNPAFPEMKSLLNRRIKNREPFRPFAPVCCEEDLSIIFEGEKPVPFMIVVYTVRKEWTEKIPAVTHEDQTGRVQTVNPEQNPLYYDLIKKHGELTGIPVLLNTSFNENEPIVHTPEQAIDCFERTKMDALAIGSFWVQKSDSDPSNASVATINDEDVSHSNF